MVQQTEHHKCDALPEYVYVMRHRIDGRMTEWQASFAAHSREGSSSCQLFVRYCPWCGKELPDGR